MYFFLQNETFKRPWEVLASHTYFSSDHVSVELESLQDDCCLYKSDVIFQSSMSFLLGGILSLEAEVCDLHHSLFLGLLCGIRMGLCHLLCQGLTTTKRQQVAVTRYTKWHWMVGCCIFGIWSIDKHWTQHQTNKRCFFPQQRPPVFAHFHGSLHQRDLGIYDGRRTVEKVNRWLSRWFVILESRTKNRSYSELLGAGKCAF